MAVNIIRAAIFRVNGRRVADVGEVTMEIDSNNTAQMGADGYLGHTDGATQSKFSATQIFRISGADVDLVGLVANKTRGKLEFFMAGKNYQVDNCVATSASIKSSTADGTLTGEFSFEGGPPKIVG